MKYVKYKLSNEIQGQPIYTKADIAKALQVEKNYRWIWNNVIEIYER